MATIPIEIKIDAKIRWRIKLVRWGYGLVWAQMGGVNVLRAEIPFVSVKISWGSLF